MASSQDRPRINHVSSRFVELTNIETAFANLDEIDWLQVTNTRTDLLATRSDETYKYEYIISSTQQTNFDLKLRLHTSSLGSYSLVDSTSFLRLIVSPNNHLFHDGLDNLDDFFILPDQENGIFTSDIINGTMIPNPDHDNEYIMKQQIIFPPWQNGFYFIHAVAMLTVQSQASNDTKLFQMANIYSTAAISVSDPPPVAHLSDRAQIFQYAIMCVTILIQTLALQQLYSHRKSSILKLSQSQFLIAFVIAGMVATVGCIFYRLENDTFCSLRLFSLMPLSVMYAILISRLWRIQSLVFRVLGQGHSLEATGKEAWIFRLFALASCEIVSRRINERSGTFRRSISSYALIRLILVLTLPMHLAVVALFLSGDKLEEAESIDGTFLRLQCRNENSPLRFVAISIFALLQVFTLGTAYLTKDLPALFNETKSIFIASWTQMVWVCLVIVGVVIAEGENSPDVSFLLHTLVTCSFVVNLGFQIIVPKLRAVWDFQEVDVTEYLQGFQRERRNSIPYLTDENQAAMRRNSVRRNSIDSHCPPTATGSSMNSDFERGYSIDKDGKPPKRFLDQIVSTMNIFNSILLCVSEKSPIARHQWNVAKARTSALSDQCEKLWFEEDVSALKQEEAEAKENENHRDFLPKFPPLSDVEASTGEDQQEGLMEEAVSSDVTDVT